MALPASVPTGTVTGTWYTPSGTLAVGTIVFLLLESIEVPDDPDGVVIPVKTVVDVPAGVLARTLPAGTYQVSVRLSELYRVTKVVEIEAGQALNLPDAVGLLLPDPDLYDPVRSVNGVFPDAYGNIEVSGGGGTSDHGALTGLADDDHSQYLTQARADEDYSLLGHTHVISNVTGLQAALDGKQPTGSYTTTTQLTDGLATKANTVHTHVISDTTGLQAAIDGLKHRVVTIRDTSQGTGYAVVSNGDTWGILATSPEYTIQASVGEYIKIAYNLLAANEADWGMDLVVVTGGTPTIQRYMATNTSTPAFIGNSNNYPIGQPFIGRSGVGGFVVEAGDLDSGNVRFRWAVKATNAGTLFASANYPLIMNIENIRTPA